MNLSGSRRLFLMVLHFMPSKPKPLILMADDNEEFFFVINETLSRHRIRCQLQHVQDGQEMMDYLKGLEDAKNPIPSLLLMDLAMPKIRGYELLDWMRSLPASGKLSKVSKLPVIVITGADDADTRENALHFGANALMVKHNLVRDPSEFIAEVKKHLPSEE